MSPRPNSSVAEILHITRVLIAELDVSGVTVDLIAEKAGVSKTTIYRRWQSRDELILEAIMSLRRPEMDPDTGSLRQDLTILLLELVDFLNNPEGGRVHASFLNAAVRSPKLAAINRDERKRTRANYERAIHRAIARKEIRKDANVRLMIDLLISPFLLRRLVENASARKSDIAAVLDIVLSSYEN